MLVSFWMEKRREGTIGRRLQEYAPAAGARDAQPAWPGWVAAALQIAAIARRSVGMGLPSLCALLEMETMASRAVICAIVAGFGLLWQTFA